MLKDFNNSSAVGSSKIVSSELHDENPRVIKISNVVKLKFFMIRKFLTKENLVFILLFIQKNRLTMHAVRYIEGFWGIVCSLNFRGKNLMEFRERFIFRGLNYIILFFTAYIAKPTAFLTFVFFNKLFLYVSTVL